MPELFGNYNCRQAGVLIVAHQKAILEAAGQKADQNVLEVALADNKAIDIRSFLGGKKLESAKAEDA
jgi:hypothetical protein